MKIDLKPYNYGSKDEFIRAVLSEARDLASDAWGKANCLKSTKLIKEVESLSKQELARRVLSLMTRPVRHRAVIDDAMRRRADQMRTKGKSVRDIALELGVSIPSVYNITR